MLQLVLRSEPVTFRASSAAFLAAFPAEDRFRACCSLVLLQNDAASLRLPQKLASWFLLYDVWAAADQPAASNPFVSFFVKARGPTRLTCAACYLMPPHLSLLPRHWGHPLIHTTSPLSLQAASDPALQPLERNLVLQLLFSHGLQEVCKNGSMQTCTMSCMRQIPSPHAWKSGKQFE